MPCGAVPRESLQRISAWARASPGRAPSSAARPRGSIHDARRCPRLRRLKQSAMLAEPAGACVGAARVWSARTAPSLHSPADERCPPDAEAMGAASTLAGARGGLGQQQRGLGQQQARRLALSLLPRRLPGQRAHVCDAALVIALRNACEPGAPSASRRSVRVKPLRSSWPPPLGTSAVRTADTRWTAMLVGEAQPAPGVAP